MNHRAACAVSFYPDLQVRDRLQVRLLQLAYSLIPYLSRKARPRHTGEIMLVSLLPVGTGITRNYDHPWVFYALVELWSIGKLLKLPRQSSPRFLWITSSRPVFQNSIQISYANGTYDVENHSKEIYAIKTIVRPATCSLHWIFRFDTISGNA